MADLLNAPWFFWAVGIAIGLPLGLVLLTEWQHSLRRRGSALLRPVNLLRNFLLPFGALLMLLLGATQMPAQSAPVRVVGTLVAVVVVVLILSGIKAALFQSAPEGNWRGRIPSIFVDVVRFGLIAIGVALILSYIWGANIAGLFTALGIGSIVIGLALQNSVGQIISGLLMLFEQPFRLGDWIEIDKAKGRVIEVNWRAVHLETSTGVRVTPNSKLAESEFLNLSRPAGLHVITVDTVFATEDRPDQVCAVLNRVAARLPQCRPDASPESVPKGTIDYSTEIPIRSPGQASAAKATFLRWLWYAARRAGLHLDEADDVFSEPELVAEAIATVVAPVLRLDARQQQTMQAFARIERYGAGEMIQPAGVVPDAVSFVMSGQVMITAENEDGVRTEVDTIERGSILGQSTLIRYPVPGSSVAIDEVALIRIDREAIEDVVHRNPLLLQEFGRIIDERRARIRQALIAADQADDEADVEADDEADDTAEGSQAIRNPLG